MKAKNKQTRKQASQETQNVHLNTAQIFSNHAISIKKSSFIVLFIMHIYVQNVMHNLHTALNLSAKGTGFFLKKKVQRMGEEG